MDNQRNLIVAVVLCLALLLGFDLVMGRLYPQPEHATTQAAAPLITIEAPNHAKMRRCIRART